MIQDNDRRGQRGGTIYYDITGIMDYFSNQSRISGIQRVSVLTISQFAQNFAAGKCKLIGFHPKLKRALCTDISFFENQEFNPGEFLRYFDIPCRNKDAYKTDNKSRYSTLEQYLFRRYKSKFSRIIHKYRLQINNTFQGGALFERRGIIDGSSTTRTQSVARWEQPNIQSNDVIFIPGDIWGFNKYVDFIRMTREASNNKVVMLVHDLIPLTTPAFVDDGARRQFGRWLSEMCSFVDSFLTVSDSTKKDLLDYLSEICAREIDVGVIPLAHEFVLKGETLLAGPAERSPSKFKGPALEKIHTSVLSASHRPYVLCVGTIEGRKNNWGLATTWASIGGKYGLRTPKLLFAGRRGWSNDDFFKFIDSTGNINGSIGLVENPSDEELAYLYKNSLFTVFPSYYEGWGLPIGESLWFGKPVVASNTSSMREVGGDVVDYVDPYDLEALEAAIIRMLDPDYRSKRTAAVQSMHKRTWVEVAKDIRAALETKLDATNAAGRG